MHRDIAPIAEQDLVLAVVEVIVAHRTGHIRVLEGVGGINESALWRARCEAKVNSRTTQGGYRELNWRTNEEHPLLAEGLQHGKQILVREGLSMSDQ